MNLTFIVDLAANKATSTGNLGTGEVGFVNGVYAISFIEKIAVGNIMTTTIEHKSGKAVHSRHTNFLLGGAIYSQWYGKYVEEINAFLADFQDIAPDTAYKE